MSEMMGTEINIYCAADKLPQDVNDALDAAGISRGPYALSEIDGGIQIVDECNYGIAALDGMNGTNLGAVLRAHEIEYDYSDTGKYEMPGSREYWRKGMDAPGYQTMAGEAVALTESEFKGLDNGDAEATLKAIRAYFGN